MWNPRLNHEIGSLCPGPYRSTHQATLLLISLIPRPQKRQMATKVDATLGDGVNCPIWSLFLEHLRIEDPLGTAAVTCIGLALLCWIVSIITSNYSQVDKLWSITPVVYAWILVVGGGRDNTGGANEALPPRSLLMALVVTVWGVRLTYNFGRRDGYSWPRVWEGEEDYRWQLLREGKLLLLLRHPVAWHVFNFTFISFYQNILLWLLVVPPMMIVHIVATAEACGTATGSEARDSLLGLDYFFVISALACIGIESIADDQQFAFQSQKYELLQCMRNKDTTAKSQLAGDYADGFLQSGLFAIVRKPNYAAEQAFWFTFYGWSASAAAALVGRFEYNQLFAATGSVLLILLFQLSGPFTENISCNKYPRYIDYQQRVPLYVPWLFGLPRGYSRRQHRD